MTFDDDEAIDETQSVIIPGIEPIALGSIREKLPPGHNADAPLEKCKFDVTLELKGVGTNRHGLDLVMVLDISGSMRDEDKLEKLKKAVQFVIKKLSPTDDRLSVVTFNRESKRLFPLRRITENSQNEIEHLVNGLAAGGSRNIAAGLETGLQVLKDRRHNIGRAVAIMLVSDGEADPSSNAAEKVEVGDVPVFTFGFGRDQDAKVLSAIAGNSLGGTFSDVGNPDHLSDAFAQCLGGLLTVAVQDLKLTVTKKDSEKITSVSPRGYLQSKNKDGSLTTSFGDLYIGEVRKITVELRLSAAVPGEKTEVLGYSYSYKVTDSTFKHGIGWVKPFEINTRSFSIPRKEKKPGGKRESVEEMLEEKRVLTAKMMTEARVMADENKLEDARRKLDEARAFLVDEVDESHPSITMLMHELEYFWGKLGSTNDYNKEGRPFALSCESSHNTQRFAFRGDDPNLARHFATLHMDEHLELARSFDTARG